VYMVARNSHGDEFAAAQLPPVELTTPAAA
jgi:hypothetical protein